MATVPGLQATAKKNAPDLPEAISSIKASKPNGSPTKAQRHPNSQQSKECIPDKMEAGVKRKDEPMNATPYYFQGVPLDVYRAACLKSQISEGKDWLLDSGHPSSKGTNSIDSQVATTIQSLSIESQQTGWLMSDRMPSEWLDPELIKLRAEPAIDAHSNETLAWIEAFKLWLPEYCEEIDQRSQSWNVLPLHLSFADMAGIDLHCLPPLGSYLNELLMTNEVLKDSLPFPRHDEHDIRQKIRHFFSQEPGWSIDMLNEHCKGSVLNDLGLQKKRAWRTRVKRLIRNILPLKINRRA